MKPREIPKLDALTGVRYIAALTVLLGHIATNFPPCLFRKYAQSLSGIGMSLFFVLSGFLMAYNYSDGFQSSYRPTLRRYLVARFARIYPIYVVAYLLSFSVCGNFFTEIHRYPVDVCKSLLCIGTMTQSWFHIPVFADSPFPRSVCLAYLGVAWSVSTEAFFYLAFPLVVLPIARAIRSGPGAVVACAIVYLAYMSISIPTYSWFKLCEEDPQLWRWLVYLCPYIRFGEFAIGAIVGQYFLTRNGAPINGAGNRWFAAACLTICIATLFRLNYFINSNPVGYTYFKLANLNILMAPICVGIIFLLASLPCLLQRILGSALLILLGNASYAMYLIHPLFLEFFAARIRGEEDFKGRSVIIYNTLALIVSVHIFSVGLYRYIEVPMRDWIRKMFEPAATRGTAGGTIVLAEFNRSKKAA